MGVERYQGWAWIACDVCDVETDPVPFQTGADEARPELATAPGSGSVALGWGKVGSQWRCPSCVGRERAATMEATCLHIACPECGFLIQPGACCGGCLLDARAADEDIAPYCNTARPTTCP